MEKFSSIKISDISSTYVDQQDRIERYKPFVGFANNYQTIKIAI